MKKLSTEELENFGAQLAILWKEYEDHLKKYNELGNRAYQISKELEELYEELEEIMKKIKYLNEVINEA